jgi:hypothetical protein
VREDHEELILRNPALAACALWHLSRSYADACAGTSPSLPLLTVGTAMLFHAATVEKVSGMRFDSGLLKAVADEPELIAGIQVRVEAALPICLSALQVGTAAGILSREGGSGLPIFRAVGADLPAAIRNSGPPAAALGSTARRLGTWFAADDIATVLARLAVRL